MSTDFNKLFLVLSLCAIVIALSVVIPRRGLAENTEKEVKKTEGMAGGSVATKYTKPSESELRAKLTPEQFDVTQNDATERPFANPYWDNKKPGIYVDVATGEPLFSSLDKFDSGTGWPSFSRPLENDNITMHKDSSLFQPRVEVRSKHGDSHLGHVFDDGPTPTGQRFCMNSASMRFIPAEDLESTGYGNYAKLFPDIKQKGDSTAKATATEEKAILAGGCFWGMQEIIRKIPGVISSRVGYTGGSTFNPTYEVVSSGTSGHAEAVEIVFDPAVLSYTDLLGYFFRMHDATTLNQQHNDRGTQYRSEIFYENEQQKQIALEVIEKVNKSGKFSNPVVTAVEQAKEFYPAEEYHQDYLVKHPDGYTCHYLRD